MYEDFFIKKDLQKFTSFLVFKMFFRSGNFVTGQVISSQGPVLGPVTSSSPLQVPEWGEK